MSMTVAELMERLEDYDPDAEVRVAFQPNYPLQSHIAGVCSKAEAVSVDEDAEEIAEMEAKDQDGEKIVYIADGGQVYDEPYAMRSIWDAAGGC